MERFRVRRLIAGLAISMLAVTGAGGVVAQEASPAADGYGGELVKDILVEETVVASAPGETLSLTRYYIPPGAVLPVHMHPGVQMAEVEQGTLTYNVLVGEVLVFRADGTEEVHGAGSTIELNQGDSFIEPMGMIHFGENRGDEEVILISAALFATDEPATILVDPAATPEATPAA